MTVSVDNRTTTDRLRTSITLEAQPVILRLSLREILFMKAIVTKAMDSSFGDRNTMSGETAVLRARGSPERGRISISSLPQLFRTGLPIQTPAREKVHILRFLDGTRLTLFQAQSHLPRIPTLPDRGCSRVAYAPLHRWGVQSNCIRLVKSCEQPPFLVGPYLLFPQAESKCDGGYKYRLLESYKLPLGASP